jgi:hypothetical protein
MALDGKHEREEVVTLEVKAYSGLGPGEHDVTVTDCKITQSKRFGGDYLRWEYTDDAGRTITENSSTDITPGNRTGKRFSALLGKPVEVGEHYAPADVIGRPAKIFVEMDGDYPKVVMLVARKATAAHRTASAEAVANSEGTQKAADLKAGQEGDPTDPDALPF